MSVLVVAGSKTSTPNRGAPAYAAASARFFSTDRVRVGGATFIDTQAPIPGRPPHASGARAWPARSWVPAADQAVTDTRAGAGRVGRAHQPPPEAARSDQPPSLAAGDRVAYARAAWATASAGTANTSVGVAGTPGRHRPARPPHDDQRAAAADSRTLAAPSA